MRCRITEVHVPGVAHPAGGLHQPGCRPAAMCSLWPWHPCAASLSGLPSHCSSCSQSHYRHHQSTPIQVSACQTSLLVQLLIQAALLMQRCHIPLQEVSSRADKVLGVACWRNRSLRRGQRLQPDLLLSALEPGSLNPVGLVMLVALQGLSKKRGLSLGLSVQAGCLMLIDSTTAMQGFLLAWGRTSTFQLAFVDAESQYVPSAAACRHIHASC